MRGPDTPVGLALTSRAPRGLEFENEEAAMEQDQDGDRSAPLGAPRRGRALLTRFCVEFGVARSIAEATCVC